MTKFRDIKEGEYPPITPGTYTVKIDSIEKTMKDGGTFPYYKVDMIINKGEYANRHVWENLSLSPNGPCPLKIKAFCVAVLGDVDNLNVDVGDNPEFDQFMMKLKNRKLRVLVDHEPSYKDKKKMTEVVVDYFQVDGVDVNEESNVPF